MAYATSADYEFEYKGTASISDDEFDSLAERASDIIDELTMYRIGALSTQSAFNKKMIIRATCAQIEHLALQGVENAVSGGSDGSYNIGNTSITRSMGAQSNSTGAAARISPLCVQLLAPTGLLFRGADTVC